MVVKQYKFNDEVTLEFDFSTTFTMQTVMMRPEEEFPKDTMLSYYRKAAINMGEEANTDNVEDLLTRDFKEKGNEYVVAKMYLGCYLLNLTDFVMYPGDVEGDVLRETKEIWDKYGMKPNFH